MTRDLEKLSVPTEAAGFLTCGSAHAAAFPMHSISDIKAECSPFTVTRSYRNCTCFPFTRSRSGKMLHGGTVCSLVFLFLAGHSLPNDVIIHRCRRNDKQRSAFCRNSVNYTRENPVWRRGFSTAKKQPPTEVGGCIGKVFTFPVRSSRGYRAAQSTSRTGFPWSGSSGCG